MNYTRGFRRLWLVYAIASGLVVIFVLDADSYTMESGGHLILAWIMHLIGIVIIYRMMVFVVNGFKGR
jgi:hypothetical protein